MYRSNCSRHLYYVGNVNEVHSITCLYCGGMQYFANSEDIKMISPDSVYQDKIYDKYHIKYEYNYIANFVQKLIAKNPTLTNYEVLIQLQIHLYKMVETSILKMINESKNPFKLMYLKKELKEIKKDLEELEKQKEYENKKLVLKKII